VDDLAKAILGAGAMVAIAIYAGSGPRYTVTGSGASAFRLNASSGEMTYCYGAQCTVAVMVENPAAQTSTPAPTPSSTEVVPTEGPAPTPSSTEIVPVERSAPTLNELIVPED
jgi:hypothetical protein